MFWIFWLVFNSIPITLVRMVLQLFFLPGECLTPAKWQEQRILLILATRTDRALLTKRYRWRGCTRARKHIHDAYNLSADRDSC